MIACALSGSRALFSGIYLVFTAAWKVYLSLVPKQVAREISGWKLARKTKFSRANRESRENARVALRLLHPRIVGDRCERGERTKRKIRRHEWTRVDKDNRDFFFILRLCRRYTR